MLLPEHSIIASGPVIIEDDKVLLNKEQKPDGITPWLFPGGEVEQFDISLEEACQREVREEMGIDVEIIRPLKPMMVKRPDQPNKLAILIHYLAKRKGEVVPGEHIVEWGWHDIHALPSDVAPNVKAVIDEYLKNHS